MGMLAKEGHDTYLKSFTVKRRPSRSQKILMVAGTPTFRFPVCSWMIHQAALSVMSQLSKELGHSKKLSHGTSKHFLSTIGQMQAMAGPCWQISRLMSWYRPRKCHWDDIMMILYQMNDLILVGGVWCFGISIMENGQLNSSWFDQDLAASSIPCSHQACGQIRIRWLELWYWEWFPP